MATACWLHFFFWILLYFFSLHVVVINQFIICYRPAFSFLNERKCLLYTWRFYILHHTWVYVIKFHTTFTLVTLQWLHYFLLTVSMRSSLCMLFLLRLLLIRLSQARLLDANEYLIFNNYCRLVYYLRTIHVVKLDVVMILLHYISFDLEFLSPGCWLLNVDYWLNNFFLLMNISYAFTIKFSLNKTFSVSMTNV